MLNMSLGKNAMPYEKIQISLWLFLAEESQWEHWEHWEVPFLNHDNKQTDLFECYSHKDAQQALYFIASAVPFLVKAYEHMFWWKTENIK